MGSCASLLSVAFALCVPQVALVEGSGKGTTNGLSVGSSTHQRYVCDPVFPPQALLNPPEEQPVCAPQLLVIGAEKSGTTSVHEYLKAHPDFLSVNKTFLLSREDRARLVATMAVKRRNIIKMSGGRLPPPLLTMLDVDRMRQHAGGLTDEEVNAAAPSYDKLQQLRPQEIESYFSPVRVGKEVRYWMPSFHLISRSFDFNTSKAYGVYLDIFPRVPAPPFDGEKLPQHLAANVGKVIGEASPQYLDAGDFAAGRIYRFAPNTRLLVLLREPVRRFRSQAAMIHGMKGRAMDPSFDDFENNVRRCLGDEELSRVHHTVENPRVPGGGVVVRARRVDWQDVDHRDTSGYSQLVEDSKRCFSHALAPFLFRGVYYLSMHEWLVRRKYPRSQVLVLPSERLYQDPVGAMNRITDFAGLRQMPAKVWKDAARFKYSPLFHPLNVTFELKKEEVGQRNQSASLENLRLSRRVEDLLHDFYAEANCPLKKLLAMDWSKWGWSYCGGSPRVVPYAQDSVASRSESSPGVGKRRKSERRRTEPSDRDSDSAMEL